MSNFFKKISWQTLIPSVVFVLLGLVLAIWPQSSVKAVCILSALFMAAVGLVCLYCYFHNREDMFSGRINLICSILMIAIALWIGTRSNYFLSLIPILASVTVMIHGLVNLRQALLLHQARENKWWLTLIIAFLAIILGFVMFLNPFETHASTMAFIGIVLIAVGISDVFVLTQGVGVVPLPGRSRAASAAIRRQHSQRRKKETLPPLDQEEDAPELSVEEEEMPGKAEAAPRRSSKSKGLMAGKLKSDKRRAAKAEKASRMSKLERVLGGAPETATPSSSDSLDDLDILDDLDDLDDLENLGNRNTSGRTAGFSSRKSSAPSQNDDFRIPETTSSSPAYSSADDEDDDFWDDEEWDKL